MPSQSPDLNKAICLLLEYAYEKREAGWDAAAWRRNLGVYIKAKKFVKAWTGSQDGEAPQYTEVGEKLGYLVRKHRRNPGDGMDRLREVAHDVFEHKFLHDVKWPEHLKAMRKRKLANLRAREKTIQRKREKNIVAATPNVDAEQSQLADTGLQEPGSDVPDGVQEQSGVKFADDAGMSQVGETDIESAMPADSVNTDASTEYLENGDADTEMKDSASARFVTAEPTPSILDRLCVVSPPALPVPRHLDLKVLEDGKVAKALHDIQGRVEDYVFSVLQSLDIGLKRPTVWVHRPEDELKNSMAFRLTGEMGAENLIVACLTATIFDWVFAKPLPWQGPGDILAELQDRYRLTKWVDKTLDEACGDFSIEEIVWRKARDEVLQDADFRQEVMMPLAKSFANGFWEIISPQLTALGAANLAPEHVEAFYIAQAAKLGNIFMTALTLKGLIEFAPNEFRLAWVMSGEELQRDLMEERHPSVGREKVTWCISPVAVRLGVDGEEDQVIRKATVYTRSWPETAA